MSQGLTGRVRPPERLGAAADYFRRNNPDRSECCWWLHRAARIIFSMNYHLGNWTPQEAVDFLVERVGHERANAEAEVRGSAIDAPLYQIAYMIGGLQFREIHCELVDCAAVQGLLALSPSTAFPARLLYLVVDREAVRSPLTIRNLYDALRSIRQLHMSNRFGPVSTIAMPESPT